MNIDALIQEANKEYVQQILEQKSVDLSDPEWQFFFLKILSCQQSSIYKKIQIVGSS